MANKRYQAGVLETGSTVAYDGTRPRTAEGKRNSDCSTRLSIAHNERKRAFNIRDIQDVPTFGNYAKLDLSAINWKRRKACERNAAKFLKTYMPNVFYLKWASFHTELIRSIEDAIRNGGKKAFGLPRGSGKTAIVRGMIIWATAYGFRKFPFFIGSREDKAQQTLSFIQSFWYRSTLLRQDFPEIAYPIYRIEGRGGAGVAGQLYKEQRTHLVWSSKEVQYPSMLFDEEDIQHYLKHDREKVIYLPDIGNDIDRYIIRSSGTVIRVAGIDGSIRGEAEIHPILLSQPRPDLILLDDVQKDQKADSPKACEDLIRLIESAVDYLGAPDVSQAILMPCTVIREGDVSDIYLTPEKKPEWSGVRKGVITKYPQGITDTIIYDEINGKPYKQGELWLQYQKIREKSLLQYGDIRLATEFYRKHRKIMSRGFVVSWKDRFVNSSNDPNRNEVDALQSAMNWRFKDLYSFLSEAQNMPSFGDVSSTVLLAPKDIAAKVSQIPQYSVAMQWTDICAFIDVQDEILFYAVLAFDKDYNGQFIDYGTFPKVNAPYFNKSQQAGWSLLSKLFWKENPGHRDQVNRKQRQGMLRAPFEAKIYNALRGAVSLLLAKKYPVHEGQGETRSIRALAIDTQWGKSSEVVKRFIRETGNPNVISYRGNAFPPSYKQLEEYEMRDGWLFEHQQHPHVREAKWCIKPDFSGAYILADVNRLKSFLMDRFATPFGSDGCFSLYSSPYDSHRMFAEHVAGSEYPKQVISRGITKDCWETKPTRQSENDYFDCAVGCTCLASICGASIKTTEKTFKAKRVSLRSAYNKRRSYKKK